MPMIEASTVPTIPADEQGAPDEPLRKSFASPPRGESAARGPARARLLLSIQTMALEVARFYRFLAGAVNVTHGLVMLIWGLGLPLVLWHRFARLSRAYMWFSVSFVVLSLLSHQIFGECFLTTLSRHLRVTAGVRVNRVPFTVVFVNAVAGIRPSTREAVLLWETTIATSCVATLLYWRRARSSPSARSGAR